MISSSISRLGIGALALALLYSGCGDDENPMEPTGVTETPVPPNSLLVDRLAVSVVPGATENVTVSATDAEGNPVNISASSSAPSLVSVTVAGNSVVAITGNGTAKASATGQADVTVTSDAGLERVIPVTVYDPKVMDVGGMLIKFVDQYDPNWDDAGSSVSGNFRAWDPQADAADGWYALGSVGQGNRTNPTDKAAVIVVKEVGGSGALAPPLDYTLIWNDAGCGGCNLGGFWKPEPPPGYKALGIVAIDSRNKPSVDAIRCVREDLTTSGKIGAQIWNDAGSSADRNFSCYDVELPDSYSLYERAFLVPGTFVGVASHSKPMSHEAANVLNVTFPLITEAAFEVYRPRLSSLDEPDARTQPTLARAVLVPFTAISDNALTLHEKVTNSPFYIMERRQYYLRQFHQYNGGSEVNAIERSWTKGISQSQTDTFSASTSVTISKEAGVDLKGVSSKVTTTLSITMGYERSKEVAAFEESTISTTVNVPPGKAAALWRRASQFRVKRHNGTATEDVGTSAEISSDSFVIAEYPPVE